MSELFAIDVSPFELMLRVSVIYVLLIILIRFIMRRRVGQLEVADILLLVLIADAVSNGLQGEYKSITGAIIVGVTLIALNFLIDYISFKNSFFRELFEPTAIPLIQDGVMVEKNLRSELISIEELYGQLRKHGIEDIKNVKQSYLESDGAVSVITFKS